MTTQPERTPGDATQAAPAPGQAGPPTAKPAVLPALLSPVPCPGTPPGTTMPGVLAAGAPARTGASRRSPGWPTPPPASPTARQTPARCSRYGNRHAATPSRA
jgi:hypothetical protein